MPCKLEIIWVQGDVYPDKQIDRKKWKGRSYDIDTHKKEKVSERVIG